MPVPRNVLDEMRALDRALRPPAHRAARGRTARRRASSWSPTSPTALADVLGHERSASSARRSTPTAARWLDELDARHDQAGADQDRLSRSTTAAATSTAIRSRSRCATRRAAGAPFALRAVPARAPPSAFHAGGSVLGGSGVVVLPCGAGKTVVGHGGDEPGRREDADPDHEHGRRAPVARGAARQDRARARATSASTPATRRTSRPVTITTYQMLTWRRSAHRRRSSTSRSSRARTGAS